MNTVPAQELKRRGISVVDEILKEKDGAVYIIKNNQPQHVVLTEGRYKELLVAENEAYMARVRASLEDVKAGRVKRGTAEELIRELALED